MKFLEWTAWQTEKFPSYGTFHLLFMLVFFTLAVLSAYALRNTTEKQHKAVLLTVGIYMTVAEIYKQFFYYYIVNGGSYEWGEFPFQLCSVPIYLCLLLPWLKEGKFKDALYDFLLAFNLLSGFVAFLEPSGLNHDYVCQTVHSLTWHMLLVFIGLYLGFSGRACKSLKGYKGACITFLLLSALAFGLNLVFRKVSEGSINMFFIGPSNNPLIILKDISAALGWYVCTPIYIIDLLIGSAVFYFGFFYAKKAILKRKQIKSVKA